VDAQPVARLPHGPLEHDGHAEHAADRANILRLPLSAKTEVRDAMRKPFHLGERVDQLVADAVAQVFIVGIGSWR